MNATFAFRKLKLVLFAVGMLSSTFLSSDAELTTAQIMK